MTRCENVLDLDKYLLKLADRNKYLCIFCYFQKCSAVFPLVYIHSLVLLTANIWLLYSQESDAVRFHICTQSGATCSMDELASFMRCFLFYEPSGYEIFVVFIFIFCQNATAENSLYLKSNKEYYRPLFVVRVRLTSRNT